MANWDDDSPRLQANLIRLLGALAAQANERPQLSAQDARGWQRRTMAGLKVPATAWVGAFRGEPGLESLEVMVGDSHGVAAARVAGELASFESTLVAVVAQLDERYPDPEALDADGLEAVIDLAAWAHAEWVRIHPFANGNGHTTRLWANVILMRYGIEPVIRMRPRPAFGYAAAGAAAMHGDWQPTAAVFRRMLGEQHGTHRPLVSRIAPRRRRPPPKR